MKEKLDILIEEKTKIENEINSLVQQRNSYMQGMALRIGMKQQELLKVQGKIELLEEIIGEE